MTAREPWMPPRPCHGPGIRCTAELIAERSCLACAFLDKNGACADSEPLPEAETCPHWDTLREEDES